MTATGIETKTPDLTVVVTNWNYGEYLQRAIASIEAQTLTPKSWFIVDDGSTDDSLEIYKALPAERLMRHPSRRGAVAAYQTGLNLCATEWIIYLDADDELAPMYVEETWAAARRSGVPWVYTESHFVDDQGRVLHHERYQDFDTEELKRRNYIHSAALIRCDLIRQVGGWPAFERGEDWELWKRIAAQGAKAVLVKRPLLRYRQHGPSRNNGGRGL